LGAPTQSFSQGRQHKLSGLVSPIGLSLVRQLLDDHLLSLVDDHAPGGVAIGLQLGRFLDYPGQSARETAKRAGSKTHIAKIKVKSSTDSLFVLDIGAVGDRGEILRQVLQRYRLARPAVRGQGMTS